MYNDIIATDYHGVACPCRMSMNNRAAQFAPFAALATGEGTPERSLKQSGFKKNKNQMTLRFL